MFLKGFYTEQEDVCNYMEIKEISEIGLQTVKGSQGGSSSLRTVMPEAINV